MPVFMFWNIGRRQIAAEISAACAENDVEILILAECEIPRSELLRHLNGAVTRPFFFEFAVAPSAVRIFLRFPESSMTPVYDDGRTSIRRFRPPVGRELILVAAHLPSKLHKNEHDQYYLTRGLVTAIEEAESAAGHRNSLVIGDFNMDPFELPMIAADGFHAVMDKRVAQKLTRTAQGRSWKFFYNPMWSRIGDESEGPPGTYYFNKGGALANLFWNTFDQVLLRPDLVPFYEASTLKVITSIGGETLLGKNGLRTDISDHLPLVLRLDVERDV